MSGKKRSEVSESTRISGLVLAEGMKAKLLALAVREKRSVAAQAAFIVEEYLRKSGGAVGGE